MPSSATLLLHNASFIPSTDPKTTSLGTPSHHARAGNLFLRQERMSVHTIDYGGCSRKYYTSCRASSSQEMGLTEFNLYELLGVEPSSDTRQIKEAYRSLQKRCHPDIAGPPGHDMAIVLNEAYALLSNPNSRMAYDKELAKVEDLQGYTGRPIYSTWSGSDNEERAVFVDEVKCIGCLKCALFAQKTFAVESVYGRARVVAQWADPEHQIHEAIGACPVDCISFVERSELPALEFIMSKLPRGKVRIGASNTAGARTADVFDEVQKFQARYALHTASKSQSKDSESQSSSRLSAVQAIQMISNWLYWQSPATGGAPLAIQKSKLGTSKHTPNLKRLRAAAEARKHAKATSAPKKGTSDTHTEYWVPSALALPQPVTPDSSKQSKDDQATRRKKNPPSSGGVLKTRKKKPSIPYGWVLPLGMSGVAAVVVSRLQQGEPGTGLREHIAGSLALEIVNSSWMQVGLAGVTWYLIGTYMLEVVVALRRK